MNQLEDLLKCALCKETFNGLPIILSCCQETICHQHLIDKSKSEEKKKKFECTLCKTSHNIDKNKLFTVNKLAGKLLNLENDFGDVYVKAKKEIESLESTLNKVNDFINDPKNYIYETVSKLKRDVDLRREKLKEKIDEISNQMIEKLDNYQKECYENIANIKLEEKTKGVLDEIKKNLEEWTKDDKRILVVSNDLKIKEIHSKAILFDTRLFKLLKDLKIELTMNKVWTLYINKENENNPKEFMKELIQFDG
jgi:hypothetical protein